jgi:hypothetical protein
MAAWNTVAPSFVGHQAVDASSAGSAAVAMAPVVAGEFGWYQVYGKAVGKAGASFADNGLVYATDTDGTVDDAVVAGDRVKRAKGASAEGTSSAVFAEFEIHHPFMDDGSAA